MCNSKASGIFWQYFRDKPALVDDGTIADFTANNADINLFKMKEITGLAGNSGTKNVKIMIPLKYLSTFWRTLEMPLWNSS